MCWTATFCVLSIAFFNVEGQFLPSEEVIEHFQQVSCTSLCPLYWYPHNGNCYRFFGVAMSWHEAEALCNMYGGHIASISSSEENTFVFHFISPFERAWIGLNDVDKEGTFVWSDGTDETFTNWAPNQPDNANAGEHCGEFYNNAAPGQWNDLPCNQDRPFMCKLHM
ncbi:echinoidin-like [Branchiostoma floridae x Branchiostoma japonicum]